MRGTGGAERGLCPPVWQQGNPLAFSAPRRVRKGSKKGRKKEANGKAGKEIKPPLNQEEVSSEHQH